MKRVRIDFAPPSLRRTLFHTPRTAVALALAALLLCGAALAGAWNYVEQQRAHEARLASLAARNAAPAPTSPVALTQPQVSDAQAAAVNAAIMQLNLPWRDLHDALRAATPASVALLALEPDAKKGVLRITAEARASNDMIAYVENMQAQEWFSAVTLTRHEIVEQDPHRPIRFQINAHWGPQ